MLNGIRSERHTYETTGTTLVALTHTHMETGRDKFLL